MTYTTNTHSVSKISEGVSRPAHYSWSGFKSYAWTIRWEFSLSLLFLLASFGQKLFSNTLSIDTQAIIQNHDALYKSWIQLSRYGFVWLKRIAGTYWYNNALSGFLTVVLFALTVFIWGYVFYEISHHKKQWHIAFFAIPIFVSPVMAEQLGFLLQSPSVCIGMTITAFAVMAYVNASFLLSTSHNTQKRLEIDPLFSNLLKLDKKVIITIYYLAAVVLLGAAFSLYTAQLSLFISAVAMVFVYYFYESEQNTRKQEHSIRNFIIVPAVLCILGYLLYALVNKLALFYYHTETSDYVKDQIRWGKDGLRVIARNIIHHAQSMYLGERIYYSVAFTCLAAFVLIGLWIRFILKKTPASVALIALPLFISPLLMNVLLGGISSIRTEYVYAYAFGFFFMTAYEIATQSTLRAPKTVAVISWILLFSVGFVQGSVSNRIFYTEQVIYEQDVRLAAQLAERIGEVANTEHPSEPVVYIGTHTATGNADTYKSNDLDLIGRSVMEISFSTMHGDSVKNQFMGTQGYSFALPNAQQEKEAEKVAQSMPHWPAQGSVQKINGIIIVNF